MKMKVSEKMIFGVGIVAAAFLVIALSGCGNTISGVGQDISDVGKKVTAWQNKPSEADTKKVKDD